MSAPIVPPDLDTVRRLLRGRMADIPTILAEWPEGEGPLADVPLLDPGMVAPRVFTELSGTVRVAATSPTLITVAGLLEIPTGGILVTAMTVSPHDLAGSPDEARGVLAAEGARRDHIGVEVVALLSSLDPEGGPAAGVGIARPLVLAQPDAFPHPDDGGTYDAALHQAARDAVAEDREVISDLAGGPLDPLPGDLARIWSPIFDVARAATVGLAARSAQQP